MDILCPQTNLFAHHNLPNSLALVTEGIVGKNGQRQDSCSANHSSNKSFWMIASNRRAEHTASTPSGRTRVPTPRHHPPQPAGSEQGQQKQTGVRGGWVFQFAHNCKAARTRADSLRKSNASICTDAQMLMLTAARPANTTEFWATRI